MEQKKIVVIGASTNLDRYSNKAVKLLVQKGYNVFAIGKTQGTIEGVEILNEKILFQDIDTVTLYLNPINQKEYFDYIIALNPKRVIFNPGTENHLFYKILEENAIEVEIACTLVLLTTNQF